MDGKEIMLAPIVHVLGARPNFPKAAPVIEALAAIGRPESGTAGTAGSAGTGSAPFEQVVIHTGQHYDERMSEIFFRELGLPEPDVNLGVGSGSHAAQTAALMIGLEKEFIERSPALVIVYGDVNSTIAAALVAAKLHIPMAHVEAGLRSFDMTMPEEVNRRLTDQLSDLCFVTSPEAIGHLASEGVDVDRTHLVGNPMIDTLLKNLDKFDTDKVRAAEGLPERYVLATMHRPANVDDPVKAAQVVAMLRGVASQVPLVLPLHPRGRPVLESVGLAADHRLRIIEPLGYLDFLSLVRGAAVVVTDSGGIQEETTVLGVPCLTVRPNTERPITITHGTNRLVEPDGVEPAVRAILAGEFVPPAAPPPLWDGHAGERIAAATLDWLAARPV
jgi:UDP-N-acetylglucosamine 2-epimerase (non-hydrolysing)